MPETKLIADNRRARHDYHLLERIEAGLQLTGTEVKSLRAGGAQLGQAYAEIREGDDPRGVLAAGEHRRAGEECQDQGGNGRGSHAAILPASR